MALVKGDSKTVGGMWMGMGTWMLIPRPGMEVLERPNPPADPGYILCAAVGGLWRML